MKVHFAGLEQAPSAAVLEHLAGVRYGLFSVFSFICKEFDIKPLLMGHGPYIIRNATFNQTIMDSGLFTLMFGAHKGKRDEEFLSRWQSRIVEFVKERKYEGVVVEVDCQKILGVEQAWKFRERMRKDLPKNEVMHVFHVEDGKQGLRDLAKFARYAAISVPEWRILLAGRKVKLSEQVYAIASEMKSVNPSLRIHLLGCTQQEVIRRCAFCDTSDSTSWQKSVRYGSEKVANQSMSFRRLKENSKSLIPDVERVMREHGLPVQSESMLAYLAILVTSAASVRRKYEEWAGSQL